MAYNKETGMYEGYIYKIYNDVNDKIYIGQTTRTIKRRWANYKYSVKNNIDNLAIHNAMKKYGIELFHIEMIEQYSFKEKEKLIKELDKKEIFYISKYNCKLPNGYNITDGGCGTSSVGCREIVAYSPYTKETQFYKSIDEAGLDNNIPVSNIIACCQNKKYSIGNKIYKYKEDGVSQIDIDKFFELHPMICQYDLFGNKLNTFLSSIEASEYLKKNDDLKQTISTIAGNIMGCCRGNRQTAYKYVWRKMNDDFSKYSLKINYPRNTEKYVELPVDVYTIDGVFVGSFLNIKDAFNLLGLIEKQTNQVLRCCRGESAMAFNYIWRFKGEPFNKYSCAIINGTIRVNKYTLDGVYVDTYNNYKYSANSVGTTNKKAISDCCNGANHNYKDFLWFHINDQKQPDKTKIIN